MHSLQFGLNPNQLPLLFFLFLTYVTVSRQALPVDIVRMDPQAFEKNQKRHFFRDIEKSFQEVTPIGPEPHQFFSF